VATIPQVFDLWQDPQERYDIYMTNWTKRTWVMITIRDEIKKLMQTYVQYPPSKAQSETYTGPIDLSTSNSSGRGISLRRKASTNRCRPAISRR